MSEPSFWTNRYGEWRWPMFVAVWVPIVVAVIGGIVFVAAYAYPTWWEDHKTERGRGDSPVTGIVQDPGEGLSPEDGIIAIEMPDDFGNFATRCVWEGWRGFTTSNDGGAFVVPDEHCEMPTVVAPEDADE